MSSFWLQVCLGFSSFYGRFLVFTQVYLQVYLGIPNTKTQVQVVKAQETFGQKPASYNTLNYLLIQGHKLYVQKTRFGSVFELISRYLLQKLLLNTMFKRSMRLSTYSQKSARHIQIVFGVSKVRCRPLVYLGNTQVLPKYAQVIFCYTWYKSR